MNRVILRTLAGPVLLWTSAALVVSGSLAAEEGCAAAACHATLLRGKNAHAPTESCESCHESTATPHPQRGTKTFKLSQSPPALCSNCHDAFGKAKHVHSPVRDGMCTTCHDPHSSNEPKLLAQPASELCQACHSEHVEYKVVHGPVSAGDCLACHLPHESDAAALVRKEGEALCVGCHLDFAELLKKTVHPALSGGCTSCHNPHGSAQPKLLPEAGAKLCFQCHDAIAETVQKASVAHPPVQDDEGCAVCHSPHASDQPKLLLKPEKEICVGCHDGILTKKMTSLHGPIDDGRCTPCHNPHGAANAKLLVRGFPADAYAPYTDGEYALCFGCHKRDLLQYPDTSFATNFRDGERNLHYLHVNNKEKGRSCKLCHALHGADNPKLIAESVPFGKWNLPLKFVKTETGGGCSPGCHKPKYYDRETPGKKPEPPPAKPKAN